MFEDKRKKNMFKMLHLAIIFKKVLFYPEFISITTKLLNWAKQVISFKLIRNDGLLGYMSILKG